MQCDSPCDVLLPEFSPMLARDTIQGAFAKQPRLQGWPASSPSQDELLCYFYFLAKASLQLAAIVIIKGPSCPG